MQSTYIYAIILIKIKIKNILAAAALGAGEERNIAKNIECTFPFGH